MDHPAAQDARVGNVADQFAASVKERPGEPWLFYPEDGDWRWLSWLDAEQVVAALAGHLRAVAAAAVGTSDPLGAAALLWRLAASRAGVPVAVATSAAGAVRWTAHLPPRRSFEVELWLPNAAAGATAVEHDITGVERDLARWTPAGLSTALGAPAERDIVLVAGSARTRGVRAAVAWAIDSRAALVLEPLAAAAGASTLAVRPSVAALGAVTRAELLSSFELGSARPGRRARAHRRAARLRALVAWDRLQPAEAARFEEIGIRCHEVPAFAPEP